MTGDVRRDFEQLWNSLVGIGRSDFTGGYRRFAWTAADAALRAWFAEQARQRALDVETDRNGNLWAWWNGPGDGAVVTGSHLDSVPDGGAYDGPLGVAAALLAIDELRRRGFEPRVPLGIVVFAEEEGARFGVACAGSRLLTGALEPDRARALVDADGVTLAAAMRDAGVDPDLLGPEPDRLAQIGAFIELHVEQGRHLVDVGHAVAVGTGILPHGRWRFSLSGQANHAGTTPLEHRADPMVPLAHMVLAARDAAVEVGGLATIGRVIVEPNGTNAVPSRVTAWLDARGPDSEAVEQIVDRVAIAVRDAAADRVVVEVRQESWSDAVAFDTQLIGRISARLSGAPLIPTGAGHDAGTLAARVPAAMLFVRNPTGVSHAPDESASTDDCVCGVVALADVLEELTCR